MRRRHGTVNLAVTERKKEHDLNDQGVQYEPPLHAARRLPRKLGRKDYG
jgi:hypothetical protein